MNRFVYFSYPHRNPSSIFQFLQMNIKTGCEQSIIYKQRKRVDIMANYKDLLKNIKLHYKWIEKERLPLVLSTIMYNLSTIL